MRGMAQVFDHDLVGKNDPLGDLTIPLDGLVCVLALVHSSFQYLNCAVAL